MVFYRRSLTTCRGGLLAAECAEATDVVLADRRQDRVARRQPLLEDRQGAYKERLGRGRAAGGPVEHGQVVEPAGEVGGLGAERLLVDGDGALEERLGAVGVEVVYFPYTMHTSSTMLRRAVRARAAAPSLTVPAMA